jgi:hypothetical protein
MKTKLKRLALPIVALALALVCGAALLVYGHLANILDSQKQARRWQGDSDTEFSQISCFMSVDNLLTMQQIYDFRTAMLTKFHEAALDIDNDQQLFCDAWSSFGTANVSSEQGKGQVSVIAVGGNYFDFHPIRLLSGSYITPDDLMQDRVLLDEETAWLLFGGTELSGMSFKINGVPFVVAGVIQREQDFASEKAYSSGMGIYMSYDGYSSLFEETPGINCYEVVMANPVKGYALGIANEKFPINGGLIVDNSSRYSYSSIIKLVKQFGERSMQTQGVVLPYWENAARCIEDYCFAVLMVAIITAILPVVLVAVYLVKLLRRGKDKLADDLLPAAKDNVQELVRVQQRKAWEKRYLKSKNNKD